MFSYLSAFFRGSKMQYGSCINWRFSSVVKRLLNPKLSQGVLSTVTLLGSGCFLSGMANWLILSQAGVPNV